MRLFARARTLAAAAAIALSAVIPAKAEVDWSKMIDKSFLPHELQS